jgi:hypothetical protein
MHRLNNNKISVEIDIDSIVHSIVYKSNNTDYFKELKGRIRKQYAGIKVYDELRKKWYSDLSKDCKYCKVIKKNELEITFEKLYNNADFIVIENFKLVDDHLDWEVKLRKIRGEERSLRLHYFIPLVAGYSIWSANDKVPFVMDGVTPFSFYYPPTYNCDDWGICIPMITLYKRERIGLTFLASFEDKIPALKFIYNPFDGNFLYDTYNYKTKEELPYIEAVYSFFGLREDKETKFKMKIVLHEPDWRSGLGWVYKNYKEYFTPHIKKVEYMTGPFLCDQITLKEKEIKELKKYDFTFMEIHGYFPHYGKYYVDKEKWYSLQKSEYKYFHGKYYEVTKEKIHKFISLLHKYNIYSFLYFQFKECYIPFVTKEFPKVVCKDENNKPITAWPGTYYTNPWDKNWQQYIYDQLKNSIITFPDNDGYFFDCFGFRLYDFVHDDGITMVNNKRASSFHLGYNVMMEKLKELFLNANKPIFANGSMHVDENLYVDSIMSETDVPSQIARQGLLALGKPGIILPPGSSNIEDILKLGLLWGLYPSLNSLNKERKKILRRYLPFFKYFRNKEWYLEKNALILPDKIKGNIYKCENRYIVPLINNERSILYKKEEVELNISDNIKKVYKMSIGGELEEVKMVKKGNNIKISLDKDFIVQMLILERSEVE